MATPQKNVAYEFYLALADSTDPSKFKVNPTIAAGDFKASIDGAAFGNLATLPVVTPSGSIAVRVNLSQAEMNGDKIMVQAIDVAGGEWNDLLIFLDLSIHTVDDIPQEVWENNDDPVNIDGKGAILYRIEAETQKE